MITLKIQGDSCDIFLRIQKNNCILLENELGIIDLYDKIYQLLYEKNCKLTGFFENKVISSRDFILLNFLDMSTIVEAFQVRKGSLMFEYVNCLLKESMESVNLNLYNEISEFIENTLLFSNLNMTYQLDEDFLKLIHSIISFSAIDSDSKGKINGIKEMLKKIFTYNIQKKYIVFYNSSFLDFDFSQYDFVYSFDLNCNNQFENYNLISSFSVKEFHLDILEKEINLLWPISYSEIDIKKILKRYFQSYLARNELVLEDVNEILMAHILHKVLNFHKKIIYDESLLDDNIKSFLTNI